MVDAVKWVIEHWGDIANAIAYIIAGASVIVKVTPTLRDDNILLGVIKFLSKYVALNKTVTDADRPK
jgi:SepF-like predicted cell division protein (DUF552 family)